MPEDVPTAPIVDSPPPANAAAAFSAAAMGTEQPPAEPAAPPADPTPAAPPTEPPAEPAAPPAAATPPTEEPPVSKPAAPGTEEPPTDQPPADAPPATDEPPTVDLKWGDEVGEDPQPGTDDEPLLAEAQGIAAELGEALDGDRREKATQLLLSTTRGRKMLSSFRTVRDVEERLGTDFTPEVFQELQAAAQNHNSVVDDLASGDPARLKNLAAELIGEGDQAYAWAPQFLDAVVETAQGNGTLGARLRSTIVDSVVNEMLDSAAAAPTQKARQYFSQVANALHKHVSGGANHPEYEAVYKGQGRTATPGQPETAESEEVRQLRARVEAQERAAAQAARATVTSSLVADIDSAINQHIDTAARSLSIPEDRQGGAIFQGVRAQFQNSIMETVKADKVFAEVYNSRIDAATAGDAQAHAHIQRAHRSAVTRAARTAWSPIFAELRATFAAAPPVADPKDELARRQANGRSEPAASGTPALDVTQKPTSGRPSLTDLQSDFRSLARQAVTS